jgi:hypothetical protein
MRYDIVFSASSSCIFALSFVSDMYITTIHLYSVVIVKLQIHCIWSQTGRRYEVYSWLD